MVLRSAPVAASGPRSAASVNGETDVARRRVSLHVPKAPEIVADKIRARIVAGTLRVGEFLPAEGRLIEEFGVSRPTLREAFRILEAQRLITVTRGARGGALIHAPDPELISVYTLLVLQGERTTVSETFDTRRLLEPPIVREVALRGGADAATRLQEQWERERAAVDDIPDFSAAIAGFHRTIVELSGNRPLIHIMQAITSVIERHQAMVMQIWRRSQPRDAAQVELDTLFKSQKKLIRLIREGDGAGAEAHWAKHMEINHRMFINGFEKLTIHELLGG